jgi:uncharacterized membrane protein YjgN (DUF898 family)
MSDDTGQSRPGDEGPFGRHIPLIPAAAEPAGVVGPQAQPASLSWRTPVGLVSLSLINALLRIVTLGVYQFWGKTELRKRIWYGVRLQGEPLEYTGTGRELFIGFLFVFALVLIPALLIPLLLTLLMGSPVRAQGLAVVLNYLAFTYLFGLGVWRAQRYRLTRTRWRGISGSLEGTPWTYGWTTLWTALLIPLTLGWIIPWRSTVLQKQLVSRMRFGDGRFSFAGTSGALYGRFAVLWLGALTIFLVFVAGMTYIGRFHTMRRAANKLGELTPTGIMLTLALLAALYLLWVFASSWYRAGQFNHFAAATAFEGAHLRGTMTGSGLLWLTLSNVLMTLFSLGVLAPLAQARSARYFLEHLAIEGPIPFDQIARGAVSVGGHGEGLAQAFDFDAF